MSNRSSNALAIALFVLAGAIILAIFAVSSWMSTQQLGSDFCSSSGPSGLLAIGIDATDSLSAAQRLDVRNRLDTAVAELPANWRVEVWNVAPSSGVPIQTGSAICKPELQVSSWTSNPKRAKERFARFSESMGKTIGDVLAQPASAESPILQSIQAIGLRSFGSSDMATVKDRRMILVSDLVQNTAEVSFARSIVPYQSFRVSKTFDALRAPLVGVKVDILFLSRPNALPASSLIGWWQEYFADIGAPLASVQRIVG